MCGSKQQGTRRQYIPKLDARQCPLGITALEDRIVQRALVEVLNAIYEEDLLRFSYGFRPKRGQHDALDAVAVGITRTKVNWILDADISHFFERVNHAWLLRFLEHRIGDLRVLRLISKWLKAGFMEDGAVTPAEEGKPQGALVSPLLANIYLHYVFDLWENQWRTSATHLGAHDSNSICRRYCRLVPTKPTMLNASKQHFANAMERFSLSLHPKKTRLIEFGRPAWSWKTRDVQLSWFHAYLWAFSARRIPAHTEITP